jgi:hypothetical protein
LALIYRSIFEVDDPGRSFVDRASGHFRDWLRFKLERPDLELPSPTSGPLQIEGIDLEVRSGSNDECAVVRITAFEGARDDGAEVKTTLTAMTDADRSWAWIDLERWTPAQQTTSWIPVAPGVVSTLLMAEKATRGGLGLSRKHVLVSGGEGALVAELVLDEARELPLVVVSYNRDEEGPIAAAEGRGYQLSRRVAGVAAVYVLGENAVSAFSKSMHEAVGEGMDVHSGAIRTYLPGVGGESDFPTRHRFIAFHKLKDRRLDLASLIIAPHLLRRAIEWPPPAAWRASARALISGDDATTYDDLLQVADGEIENLKGQVADLEELLALERDSVVDLARQVDALGRRNRFLRHELAEHVTGAIQEPEPEDFDPVFCSEVVEHARETLSLVEVPEHVLDGAEALDDHADESWGRKAWLALRALQEYAEAKMAGEFEGDFKTCCDQSATDVVVPTSWVARAESKLTMSNDRFRELRNLPISNEVSPSGRMVMEEHIKIEQGGSPSPRIHYYDDTRGRTRKIHVGWFGDHLDSRAKR